MVKDFLESLPSEILDRTRVLDLNIRSSLGHKAIDEILSRSVLQGGKRLRPLLTYLMGHLFNLELELLTPYARATELVHAASLSHDDVIDNATQRRGQPSINIISSNKKSVLAGDYLLAKVIVDLCTAGNLDLVKEMSLVIKDLSEGEWLQLDLQNSRNYTLELIREVAMKKTSSVMSYCTVAPAILSGQNEIVQKQSREFGINLGIAFQLIDDTLDFSGESLKDSMLDLKNGVVNAVFFEYLNEHNNLFTRFKNGDDLSDLIEISKISTAVEKIVKYAHLHLEMAHENLTVIERELIKTENPDRVNESIEYLKLILSYLVLRRS